MLHGISLLDFKILVEHLKVDRLAEIRIYRVLKWVSKKWRVTVCTGFSWPRIGATGGFF
jgi:hypothetical protein